jgi:hypothetical protein
LWTALIASLPRVGCMCADGTSLPYCATATISLFADQPKAVDCCCCCGGGDCCGDSDAPRKNGPKCPISGLPCRAVITSSNPATLVDITCLPSPFVSDELPVVVSNQRPTTEATGSPLVLNERPPLPALLDLGQLLRV